MTVRVLLVDDHPVVLDGLEGALAREPDLAIAGQATSCDDARSILAREAIDVALVDIRLPDGSGLELMSEYGTAGSGPAWIVLSSFETPQYVAAAVSLGAAGYLLKTAPIGEVVEAIRRVAAGATAFTAEQLRAAASAGTFRLRILEREIVRGVVAGRSNDEIARELGVARKTVEAHLTRLFNHFGVSSRTELALRAEREGWLESGCAPPARD